MKKSLAVIALSITAAVAACTWGVATLHASGDPAPSVSPDEALAKLKEGNKRFVESKVTAGKPVADKRAETGKGQRPFAIIVTCSDSRTSPELIFDQSIGDIFVVRTAGNLAGDHALGSIEYAVDHLGSKLIVVLGHERCGAVTAAMQTATAPGHVQSIVSDIQPAVKAAAGKEGDPLVNTVKANAESVANTIRTGLKPAELAAKATVVTGYYDLDSGEVEWAKP